MGSSIKDVRTDLGIFGTPTSPVHACPGLVDHPSPPLSPFPCPCGHKAGIV